MGTIRLVDPQGITRDVPDDAAGAALDAGWRPENTRDAAARAAERAHEADYGGAAGTAKAALAGAARTVTLGGSDVAMRAIGGEGAAIDLQGLSEVNPGATFAGELAGAFVPVGPAAAAARLGHGIQKGLAGASAASRVGAAAAGGAVAGGAFGAGAGVSTLALSDDPLTVERIASTLGTHAILGAVTGGALGGAGGAVVEALGAAKGKVDEMLARRAARKATTPAEAIDTGDLGMLDKGILDDAEKAEISRLRDAQAPERKKVVDEIGEYRQADRDADDIRAIAKHSDERNVREASAAMTRSGIGLRKLLDNKIKFAENPAAALDHLRVQRQALDTISAWGKAVEAAWRADVEVIPQRVRESILAGKVHGEIGPFTPAGLDLAVERELKLLSTLQWNGAVKNGFQRPSIVSSADALQSAIERNTQLQQQLERISAPPTSPRLDKIAEARAALAAPSAPSLGDALVAAAPLAGPLGSAVAAGSGALGRMKAVADAVGERAAKTASAVLGAGERVARTATVLATRALASHSFAELSGVAPARASGGKLADMYTRRSEEIRSLVTPGPDGPVMRPDARQRMASAFNGIRAAHPMVADKLETTQARKVEWLASQLPRKPDAFAPGIGPDNWHPSDLEMRAWARKVAAANDPMEALERLAHGTFTPEDHAALTQVHPEIWSDFLGQVSGGLSSLRTRLSPQRRIALSLATGIAVDPAMHPVVLRALQSMYASEPGTAGGTAAPKPIPQMGALQHSADSAATPSQARAGHMEHRA